MNPAFVKIHPAFLRSLLASIETVPPDDMSEDDKDIYRATTRLLVLLTDRTTDATLAELWAQAVEEQHHVNEGAKHE